MNLMEKKPVILSMYDCPRFQRCSAPLCPLDPDWRIRAYHRDDPRCRYLCASARGDGRAKVPEGILVACDAMAGDPELPKPILKRLRRAERDARVIRNLRLGRKVGSSEKESLKAIPTPLNGLFQKDTPPGPLLQPVFSKPGESSALQNQPRRPT